MKIDLANKLHQHLEGLQTTTSAQARSAAQFIFKFKPSYATLLSRLEYVLSSLVDDNISRYLGGRVVQRYLFSRSKR